MDSKFDGGLLGLIGTNIVSCLLCIIPFVGVAISVCYKQRWLARHTIIEGNRLKFVGKWSKLFVKHIVWFLLTIVTVGIFLFWLGLKMHKWNVANTIIDPEA